MCVLYCNLACVVSRYFVLDQRISKDKELKTLLEKIFECGYFEELVESCEVTDGAAGVFLMLMLVLPCFIRDVVARAVHFVW